MFVRRHDFIIALRRIAAQRLYSALGSAVLALGLVGVIATYLFVSYIHGYDQNFANADRTYVIEQSLRTPSVNVPFGIASALPLGEQLRLDAPELEAVARYRRTAVSVEFDGQSNSRFVSYVEAPFFQIFDFNAVAGDLRAATMPRTAVITRHAAQQMFGTDEVVGKIVTISGTQGIDVAIVAVIEDIPAASHLASGSLFSLGFDLLVSWDVFETIDKSPFINSWGNTPVLTYALLPANRSFTAAALNDRLRGFAERRVPPEAGSLTPT